MCSTTSFWDETKVGRCDGGVVVESRRLLQKDWWLVSRLSGDRQHCLCWYGRSFHADCSLSSLLVFGALLGSFIVSSR